MTSSGRRRRGWSGGAAGQALALVACGALVLAGNLLTPLWGDDWCRHGQADGAASVLARTWESYVGWTGRIGPMLLTYLVLGPLHGGWLPWFELVNALVYMALAWLLVRLAERACAAPPIAESHGFAAAFGIQAAAGLALWWVPGSIAEAALWKTGAIGYLWAVAASAFLIERATAIAGGSPHGRPALLALGGFALLAGTFLETLSVVTLMVLAAVAWRAGPARPPGRQVLLLAFAYGLGACLLIVAPGNLSRAAQILPATAEAWLRDWYWFLHRTVDPIAVAGAMILLAACGAAGKAHAARAVRAALPFASGAVAYLAILLPLPAGALSVRLGFPASVALCGTLLALLLSLPPSRRPATVLAAALGLVALPATAATGLRDIARIAGIQRDWPPIVLPRPPPPASDQVLDLPFPAQPPGVLLLASKHRFHIVVTPDPGHWANACLAGALGVPAVRGVDAAKPGP